MTEVLDDARYILGPNVTAFEEEFAEYVGASHAIGVANGTDAITIALRAMGVGPGDEVVVPSFTFYASAEAIPPTGATPVFCDIDLETFCVTAETVRAALTPRTKAVIVVHLFGNVAPVAEIEALGVAVLEDAAQAAGSLTSAGRPGSLGTAATFSFFPSKNLGAFGDGGAITTSDAAIAERVRMLRFHGSRDKVTYEHIGYNSRLDELQAAILRVQLPHLDAWADGRRAAGAHYAAAGLGELVELPGRGRRMRPGLAPLRHPSRPRGRARGRARRRRHRPEGVLPHAAAPPGSAARLRPRARAPGDRGGGANAPRDPDERRARRGAGDRGDRGGARRARANRRAERRVSARRPLSAARRPARAGAPRGCAPRATRSRRPTGACDPRARTR